MTMFLEYLGRNDQGARRKISGRFTNLQGDLVIPYMFDRILPPYSHGTIQVDDCFDDEANTISGGCYKKYAGIRRSHN